MIDDREGWLYGSCGGGFNYSTYDTFCLVMVTDFRCVALEDGRMMMTKRYYGLPPKDTIRIPTQCFSLPAAISIPAKYSNDDLAGNLN